MKTRDSLHVASSIITITKDRIERLTRYQKNWLGKTLVTKVRARNPRASSLTNDNYCVDKLQERLLASSKEPARTSNIQTPQTQVVNFSVVTPVHFAKGHSQRKDISPVIVNCCKQRKLKYVKGVSCVDQLSFVKPVTNVQTVASNLPVGARLQNFCQLGWIWVLVQIVREGQGHRPS